MTREESNVINVNTLLRTALICTLVVLPFRISAESTTISTNLPLDVQVDLLMTELSRLLKMDDNAGIIRLIPRIRALDIEIPDSLYFLEARALYRTGEALAARDRLVVYLANTGREGRYYEQATELLLAVKEQADIQEARRREEERLRQEEARRSAEKARALRIREAQRRLYQLGFRLAVENGNLDNPTREALAVYQIRHDLRVTGDITDETLRMLESAVPDKHNCDGLAAYAAGPREWGIPVEQIPAQVAVPACNEALRLYPEVIRFQIEYARSLLAAGRASDAMTAIENAARLGYPAAETMIGHMHEMGLLSENAKPDLINALRWYRFAAEKRYPPALMKIGEFTESGQAGISRSTSEAVSWYQKAADEGYPPAQVLVADRYLSGRGLKRNNDLALKWYLRASEVNYPEALYKTGLMYERGRGVKRNKAEAIDWYRKAADLGNQDATLRLKRLVR